MRLEEGLLKGLYFGCLRDIGYVPKVCSNHCLYYIWKNLYIYIYTYVYISYKYIHVNIYNYISIYILIFSPCFFHTHTHPFSCICMYIYIYIYTYMSIYIYMYTYKMHRGKCRCCVIFLVHLERSWPSEVEPMFHCMGVPEATWACPGLVIWGFPKTYSCVSRRERMGMNGIIINIYCGFPHSRSEAQARKWGIPNI